VIPRALELTEERVLWFRARRGHLAGPGAKNASEAARAILGAQSQQLGPSLLALSARTRGRPTAAKLRQLLFEEPRSLVRTWGQRDTLFVYGARIEWAAVVAARSQWIGGGRRGGMPPAGLVTKAGKKLQEAQAPLKRSDLFPLVPQQLVREWEAKMKVGEPAARRFAAGRLFWMLAVQGHACVGEKQGSEQSYVAREHWFPELAWPERLEPEKAAMRLAEGYLSTFGPATPADLGHFFGAKVATAREWLAGLDVMEVTCGERKGLVALSADTRQLKAKPTGKHGDWPVRLLPSWDAAMMAHKDKRWLTPDPRDEKRVWRKGAFVTATVIARGRVVACWSHEVKRGGLEVAVEPLAAWRASKHLAGVKREARAVAAHLGLETASVSVSPQSP